MRPVEAIVSASVRRPWLTILLSLAVAALGLWLTVTRFAIDTNTASLISPDVGWRRMETRFDRSFPQRTDLVVAVIDAATPERAEEAADRLAASHASRAALFRSVERPDGGPFFDRNGLLFLPLDELRATLAAFSEQAGLLSILAGDTSLRGFAQTVGAALIGVRRGNVSLDDLGARFDAFSTTVERALGGQPARLSWRNLMAEQPAPTSELRKLLLVRPVMDYGSLQPGAAGTDAIRAAAAAIGLTPENGVTVRLTGPVPLADEEFATVAENMALNVGLTVLAVVAILFLALRSAKLIGAVLITLGAGLVVTSGFGILAVGRLNLISVAFFVLFIGLGVDFGIQFVVRYRAERHSRDDVREALRAGARGVGFSLSLAALSLIAGFLSFLPTEFRGVSELGLIAGFGMFVACVGSFTLLPALIVVLRPGREAAPVETAALAGIDHWIARHRRLVIAGTAAVVLAGVPALMSLRFDSDPMNLRDPSVESVATYLDLARDPQTSPSSVDVLTPSLSAAGPIAERLSALPEVSRAVWLKTFIPPDQPEKLALIAAAAPTLTAVLQPHEVEPPSDTENSLALRQVAVSLEAAAAERTPSAGAPALRLAKAFERLASADREVAERTRVALTTDFLRLRTSLTSAFSPEPVTSESLPASIRETWVAPDGTARIEVMPKRDVADPQEGRAFVNAIRQVTPDITGAPVTIAESGRTIIRAFVLAGLYSFVAITLILWIAMRRIADVLLALGPLALAGVLTLEAAQLLGLQLNFANIIALPLMFGVGVAFHIYYLIAWRTGTVDMLASSLTRAIFFSALTTGVAFGSLWASSHPGTASMGELLAVSLVFTLLAAFLVVPAFLGPPKTSGTSSPP